jgi:hypothetical protein
MTNHLPPRSQTAPLMGNRIQRQMPLLLGTALPAPLIWYMPKARLVKSHIRVVFDGQPHPSLDSPYYNSTTYIRFGNTINEVYFKGGKAVVAEQQRLKIDKTAI